MIRAWTPLVRPGISTFPMKHQILTIRLSLQSVFRFCRQIYTQPDPGIAIPAEVDPVARTEVDAAFEDARPDTPGVGEVSPLHAEQCGRHLDRGACVEAIESPRIGTAASSIDVFSDFEHGI